MSRRLVPSRVYFALSLQKRRALQRIPTARPISTCENRSFFLAYMPHSSCPSLIPAVDSRQAFDPVNAISRGLRLSISDDFLEAVEASVTRRGSGQVKVEKLLVVKGLEDEENCSSGLDTERRAAEWEQ
jgi:hypothetical protein